MAHSRVVTNVCVTASLVVGGVAVVCLAGLAGLATGLGPHALQARSLNGESLQQEALREEALRAELFGSQSSAEQDTAPATVIEQRFAWPGSDEPRVSVANLAIGSDAPQAQAAAPVYKDGAAPQRNDWLSLASLATADETVLFSPSLSYPAAPAARANSQAAAPASLPPMAPAAVVSAAPVPAAERLVTVATAAVPSETHGAAARRPTEGHFGNVLNDAQIASIKRRLKLTPDQEQMWPAVEVALRKIAYTKTAAAAHRHPAETADAAQRGSSRMAYIDPGSAEVQQLKYAAIPLIMRLNDDQKREVKSLAHVMGLEGVASEF